MVKEKKETVLSLLKQIKDILLEGRGPVSKPLFENKRLICNADGNFTDKQLPLIWAKEDLPTKMTQAEAIEACKKLGKGWYSASDKEFESIFDRTRYNPAIIPEAEVLGLKTDDWYVTRTPHAGNPGLAWCVGIKDGVVYYGYKDIKYYVRPVRSSQ